MTSPQPNWRERDAGMRKITRRTLIRNVGMAASIATLTIADRSKVAAREDEKGSVFHVFAFQWKPDTSEAQKDKAANEIAAFQGQIPGLLQTHVGPNISPRGKGYTFGGIMQFKDKASLDAYAQHPAHQALLVWLVPLIDAIELDLRA
jgi:stress responsive alpha/beta barrel protein